MLGDTLGSAGVIVSALVIWFTGWTTVDALVSLGITALLLLSGGRLLRDSVSVLMLTTPAEVDGDAVREGLLALPGIRGIHDLHIWTVNSGFVSLSCHADIEEDTAPDVILKSATALLRDRSRNPACDDPAGGHPGPTGDGDSCQILAT